VYTALQAVASPLGHATGLKATVAHRADDGIRTRDPHLGKVMRYQLRYVRIFTQGIAPSEFRLYLMATRCSNERLLWAICGLRRT